MWQHYLRVRSLTGDLCANLSDADATVQSMEDASPAKWHLAHTTWFFETFLLRDHLPDYRPFHPDFHFLFNSYYEAEGERHARSRRGMMTRPSLDEILAYRAHVDAAMQELCVRGGQTRELVTLGLHHEQQHQELLLTDILHLFAQNPLQPALWDVPDRQAASAAPLQWIEGSSGIVQIGHQGGGFAFDCEGPRHQALLTQHALASRPVTNAEWAEFIADGGYLTAAHWLSDGWAWVQNNGIFSPLYWQRADDDAPWQSFGLNGLQTLDPHAPVTHISLYEADAYASWAGARLPSEFEWESAAAKCDKTLGNLLRRAGAARPQPSSVNGMAQMFGDVWEWTGSAYRPYPGFRPAKGAIGEYNAKFMSGQFVLKGGSCATPEGHVRASYRNFFYPHQRWQFTGLRLAKDL